MSWRRELAAKDFWRGLLIGWVIGIMFGFFCALYTMG